MPSAMKTIVLCLAATTALACCRCEAADDVPKIVWKPGEHRHYRIAIEDTTTMAANGVNTKNTYPSTYWFTATTGTPQPDKLIPVTIQINRFQTRLPYLDNNFTSQVIDFDTDNWQKETPLPNISFVEAAAQTAVPIRLLYDERGKLSSVGGSSELTAEAERLLARDFSTSPAYANALSACHDKCHQNTLKMVWEGLLIQPLPEGFEPEKAWSTKQPYVVGEFYGWLKGEHTATEGASGQLNIESVFDVPKTQVATLKRSSYENDYNFKGGTGKGVIVRDADGWNKKATRDLHFYISITYRNPPLTFQEEQYCHIKTTVERETR